MTLKTSIYSALAAGFGFLFYTRYYQWIECFNEKGRCYDPDGTGQVYTDAGATWGYWMAIFFGLALWQILRRVRFRGYRL